MQFGQFASFFWGLLAVPIVIFYILKIRLRRVPVSTTMFWEQIFEEKRPRSIWQRLRHLVSLLVQLAFLSLVVLALTDPYLPWEVLRSRRVVLVVDNSASMQATDLVPNRLQQAKEQGRHLIDGLRLRDEMAIISAGSVARVEVGLTSHQRTLRKALLQIAATDSPTSVAAGVELARRLLAGHENGKVVVLTDGCFEGAAELEKADDVALHVFGRKTGNVAITRFQVRRSLIDIIGYQILVEVTNFSDEPVSCRLDIDLNNEVVDVVPLKLAAEEKWSKVIDHVTAAGGKLLAKLDVDDALSVDNQAVALLPRRKPQPVVLVTEGNLFLESIFEAIPIVDLTVTDDPAVKIPQGAVAVYHRRVPDRLPAGNVLVIDPAASTDLWSLGDPLSNPIVAKQDPDSPLMTHVRLDNVLMPEARRLKLTVDHEVLAASATDDPLFAAIRRGTGRVLVLTVNLEKGDLPLRTAFPIMITNAVTWFQGEKGELREALSTGSVVEVDLSRIGAAHDGSQDSQKRSFVLLSPGGVSRPLPEGVSRATIGPLDQHGVWTVQRALPADASARSSEKSAAEEPTPPVLEFACNLTNSQESDLRPEHETNAAVQAGVFGLGGRPIWFYLVLTAFGLIVLEWYLYQRRWIS